MKTNKSHPLFLWIIFSLYGLIGAYFSKIGETYHLISDSILFVSSWLIVIGLFIIWMSINDQPREPLSEKTGVYSAINHPQLLGEHLLIIGLNLQTIHFFSIALTILTLSLYHRWLLHNSIKGLFSADSFFKFNIWKMTDHKKGMQLKDPIQQSAPYIVFSIIYILALIELRNRSISRSLLDLFN